MEVIVALVKKDKPSRLWIPEVLTSFDPQRQKMCRMEPVKNSKDHHCSTDTIGTQSWSILQTTRRQRHQGQHVGQQPFDLSPLLRRAALSKVKVFAQNTKGKLSRLHGRALTG